MLRPHRTAGIGFASTTTDPLSVSLPLNTDMNAWYIQNVARPQVIQGIQQYAQQQTGGASAGITDWLKNNQTAVYVVAGALLVLALFAGGRR